MDLVIDLFLRCLMEGFFGSGPGILFHHFNRFAKPVHTFSLLPARSGIEMERAF